MRRMIALMLVATMASGCVTLAIQRIPTETTVSRLRGIAIAPIETPPLFLAPRTEADRAALAGVDLGSVGPGDTGAEVLLWAFCPFFSPFCPARVLVALTTPDARETATMMREEPPPWMLTAGLARIAAQLLQRAGARESFVVKGYVQLPIENRSVSVTRLGLEMENWMAPIRRWYNAEVPTLDYTQLDPLRADAILEVGVSNYAYHLDRLFIHVMVKLSDPTTKQVLGRARNISISKVPTPLAQMLQDNAQPLRRLVETTGEALLVQCLKDLRLIQH